MFKVITISKSQIAHFLKILRYDHRKIDKFYPYFGICRVQKYIVSHYIRPVLPTRHSKPCENYRWEKKNLISILPLLKYMNDKPNDLQELPFVLLFHSLFLFRWRFDHGINYDYLKWSVWDRQWIQLEQRLLGNLLKISKRKKTIMSIWFMIVVKLFKTYSIVVTCNMFSTRITKIFWTII